MNGAATLASTPRPPPCRCSGCRAVSHLAVCTGDGSAPRLGTPAKVPAEGGPSGSSGTAAARTTAGTDYGSGGGPAAGAPSPGGIGYGGGGGVGGGVGGGASPRPNVKPYPGGVPTDLPPWVPTGPFTHDVKGEGMGDTKGGIIKRRVPKPPALLAEPAPPAAYPFPSATITKTVSVTRFTTSRSLAVNGRAAQLASKNPFSVRVYCVAAVPPQTTETDVARGLARPEDLTPSAGLPDAVPLPARRAYDLFACPPRRAGGRRRSTASPPTRAFTLPPKRATRLRWR